MSLNRGEGHMGQYRALWCLCLAVLVCAGIFNLIYPLCTPTETNFGNETRLLFYALHKQATAGPCKEAKPWSWNVVESAKWQSWSQLADMSSMDAMRLYVKTLDEEQVTPAVGLFESNTSRDTVGRSMLKSVVLPVQGPPSSWWHMHVMH
jgi:acyl-CoA-binding protein